MTGERSSPNKDQKEAEASPVSAPEAMLVGWTVFAAANALATVAFRPVPQGSWWLSPVFYGYDVGHALVCGWTIAALTWFAVRAIPRFGGLRWLLAAVLSSGMGLLTLEYDLAGPAARLAGFESELPVHQMLMAGLPLLVPLAGLVASFFRARWARAVLLAGAAAACVINYRILVGDYPGAHLLVAAVSATLAGFAFNGVKLQRPKGLRLALVTSLIIALTVAFTPPPNGAIVHLSGTWGNTLARLLPRAHVWARSNKEPEKKNQFTAWRNSPRPAGLPLLPRENLIVILYSVDSLRWDLLHQEYETQFKNMHRVKSESVWFTNARAAGSQTVYSLTSMMAGTYFSQQYWSKTYMEVNNGYYELWPSKEPAQRFPEVLSAAGIPTVQYAQDVWMLNRYGMMRGFSEELNIQKRGAPRWPPGEKIMDLIEERLRKHGKGPLFVFFHDLDPHSPFDMNQSKKKRRYSNFERYLREVELVDRRLARLDRVLEETKLASRTVLIFTADHGEAFGEHGTTFHGHNLYDEQIRVPLLIRVPGLSPRKVEDNVTLMSLGPTVLDLMGQSTPEHFMAGTLVPQMRGDLFAEKTPWVIAEGRLKRSMIFPDERKVILDQRTGSKEIYDLKNDPKELNNLYDSLGDEGEAIVRSMQAFFDKYRIQREGYEIPFRR